MAERIEKYLWVKVKRAARPIKINITELHDVDALLEAVDKEKQKLGKVDSGDLQLFQSEEAKNAGSEALRPDLGVAGITGGDIMENPLYVFFPDVEVATASQALFCLDSADSETEIGKECLTPVGHMQEKMKADEGKAGKAKGKKASTELPSDMEVTAPPTPTTVASRPTIVVDEASGGPMTFGPVREPPNPTPPMPYPSPPHGVPSWPTPTRTNFLEVSAEPEWTSPRWILDRPTGKYTMVPPKERSNFRLKQAEGMFNLQDKCIYLTKAKTSPGQVEFRFLDKKYKDIFRASRRKEVKSLLDSGAIKILSKEGPESF
eukprot:s1454_g8.t1